MKFLLMLLHLKIIVWTILLFTGNAKYVSGFLLLKNTVMVGKNSDTHHYYHEKIDLNPVPYKSGENRRSLLRANASNKSSQSSTSISSSTTAIASSLLILFSSSILTMTSTLPAHAFANKISTSYDDRPKRGHGPSPTDLGIAIRKDIVGEEYMGLKHCGAAPNCFCSTDSLEDDPDHNIPAWTWPSTKQDGSIMSKEEAFTELYNVLSKEYIPGQGNIDGGGFEIQKLDARKGYLYVQFESLKYGYIDDVEFAFIPQEDASHTIQVRSSSRVGYLDYGVNAKRLNFIANLLRKRGWDAPGVDVVKTHANYALENGL